MGFARLYGRIVRFVAGFLLRKSVLYLEPLGVGFAVDEVVLGLIFCDCFGFVQSVSSHLCSAFVIHSSTNDAL